MPKFDDLESWLRWQETLHPRAIELGLARPRGVYRRLPQLGEATAVITVAGTNGKGSTVAVIEGVMGALGVSVASYTSPHLFRYNERVRFDGRPVGDVELIEAFQEVEDARRDTGLTYFEFGTLAALTLIARRAPSLAVLEVGMGGRLDAVNLIDADVAVITSIALDHQAWLGADREAIGREKAGILRSGRPLILGDRHPPRSVLDRAAELDVPTFRLGRDFDHRRDGDRWSFRDSHGSIPALPGGRFRGPLIDNASCALAALGQLNQDWLARPEKVAAGLARASLPGRLQVLPGDPEWVVDLAHNPDGASALAGFLRDRGPARRTIAVFGMLADKDIGGVVAALADQVDEWIVTGLPGDRGATGGEIAAQAAVAGASSLREAGSVADAVELARAIARPGDRVLAFGSFYLVGPVLECLGVYSAAAGYPGGHPESYSPS